LRRTLLVAVLALAAAASGCATARPAAPSAPAGAGVSVRPWVRGVAQPDLKSTVAAGVKVAF
jgi:hypothetical protein